MENTTEINQTASTDGKTLSKIMSYFRLLSDIPRGSFNLDGVRLFLEKYAKEHGFEYSRDTYGNCVIFVGDKNDIFRKNIVIQSHMDIVCAKGEDSTHDFTKDPIQFVYHHNTDTTKTSLLMQTYSDDVSCSFLNVCEGDVLTANNTTLGADNGIGLVSSMILAEQMVESNSCPNINLYLLMTSDEEAGMEGITNLSTNPSFLPETAFAINVDSEIPNEICMGSVGGAEAIITLEKYYTYGIGVNPSSNKVCYTLTLKGFVGGHSGCDIHRGNSSAIKTMSHILYQIKCINNDNIDLVEINGGSAHNAIPETCSSCFCIDPTTEDKCREAIDKIIESIAVRYNEKNITFTFEKVADNSQEKSFVNNKLINLLMVLHQGPLALSPYSEKKWCLSTSNNIGLIKTIDDKMTVSCLTRSSNTEGLREYYNQIKAACELLELCTVSEFDCYEGWNPDWNSSITLTKLKAAHQKLFGYEPNVYQAHAGLETADLCRLFPKYDAVSIGPEINHAHTPREQITMSSIMPFYNWLKETVFSLN
jgi:dipeptidase D